MPARGSDHGHFQEDPHEAHDHLADVVPAWSAPEKVKVHGIFVLAKGAGDRYEPPVRGFLYYSLDPAHAEECRKEWEDLRKLAGQGGCIAFASRYQEKGKVRGGEDRSGPPDRYPVAMGIKKVRPSRSYQPIRDLLAFPRPVSPADGAEVEPGKVTLAVRAAVLPESGDGERGSERRGSREPADRDERPARGEVEYFFEIHAGSLEREVSPAIAANGKEARWTPALAVKSGERYTWKVWLVDGDYKGPTAEMAFKGKPSL